MMLRRYHKKAEESKATQEPIREVKQAPNVIAFDDVTKSEIGKLLADKGIEYNKRDSKVKLYELLLGSE